MNKQYGNALLVGKFYPPHVGHCTLIDTARAEMEGRVYVGVCYSSRESISVDDRIAWLRDMYPKKTNIHFFKVFDDSPVLYTDDTWGLFLEALMDGLWKVWMRGYDHYELPNTIYSGEDYVPEFAMRLQRHIDETVNLIGRCPPIGYRKLDRSLMPGTSASAIRAQPRDHWNLLPPAVKAGLCKRVVVCGAESTGTTTLAKALAEVYHTPVVPEYGRHYDWAVGRNHIWTPDDFKHIATRQFEWEEDFARRSHGGLLICDTDEFATAMFAEVYLTKKVPEVFDQALKTPADLYIVTDHEGIDFEDDGTRFNSGRREWMTEWFGAQLPSPQIIVTGSRQKRLETAVDRIEKLLHWDFATPIEYTPGYEHEGMVQE